jgi:osmoprotectant transport system ATP-binding protein
VSALVELIGFAKRYGDAPALQPTNLSIAQGQTTVLIGPSGCGKSTLLRLIVGLVRPDAGEIIFDGKQIADDGIEIFLSRLGYVIQ